MTKNKNKDKQKKKQANKLLHDSLIDSVKEWKKNVLKIGVEDDTKSKGNLG